MSAIQEFLIHVNYSIQTQNEKALRYNFFTIFSRFEYALKNSTYVCKRGYILPNWKKFIKDIANDFNPEKKPELQEAVNYLISDPPKIQDLDESKNLVWKNREFKGDSSKIEKLLDSIKGVRNNLFHGGKEYGFFEGNQERNNLLLNHSITVLNEWLELHEDVRRSFISS